MDRTVRNILVFVKIKVIIRFLKKIDALVAAVSDRGKRVYNTVSVNIVKVVMVSGRNTADNGSPITFPCRFHTVAFIGHCPAKACDLDRFSIRSVEIELDIPILKYTDAFLLRTVPRTGVALFIRIQAHFQVSRVKEKSKLPICLINNFSHHSSPPANKFVFHLKALTVDKNYCRHRRAINSRAQ
jgi:hypothetical protein